MGLTLTEMAIDVSSVWHQILGKAADKRASNTRSNEAGPTWQVDSLQHVRQQGRDEAGVHFGLVHVEQEHHCTGPAVSVRMPDHNQQGFDSMTPAALSQG